MNDQLESKDTKKLLAAPPDMFTDAYLGPLLATLSWALSALFLMLAAMFALLALLGL